MTAHDSSSKFDRSRAFEYATQSRIALAGYDACHELSACLLSACLGSDRKTILNVGAGGTGQEVLTAAKLEPNWSFVAADPAPAMLDLAMANIRAAGLEKRVESFLGHVDALAHERQFDAATLVGVLHHLPGQDEKDAILHSIAKRLKPGAPLVIACNRGAYETKPLFLDAWAARWRMAGASDDDVEAKLGKIRQGAVPPASEAEVEAMLSKAGFAGPERFFSSLFWSAWICFKEASA
jgi:tRNA (cmo5U34)-methyltransferase